MTATVDGSGNAVITVPDSIINNAIQKGKEDSKKDGTAQNGISVQLNVSTGDTDTGSGTVNLPKATQEKLIAEKVDSFAVVIPAMTKRTRYCGLQPIISRFMASDTKPPLWANWQA